MLVPQNAIAGFGKAGRLGSAGREKVTMNSGAAESVDEPFVEGEPKRLEVQHVAANGAEIDKYGHIITRGMKERSWRDQRRALPGNGYQ